MKLRILQVPDCPNAALLRERLEEALGGTDADLTVQVIENAEDAAAAGMTGSPTLLVGGTDPFAEPGRPAAVSCRLYRDAEGRVTGTPSVTALRQALLSETSMVHKLADQDGQCCTAPQDTPGPWAIWQTWPARVTPADPAERAIHQAILRTFAEKGAAPGPAALKHVAAPFGIPATELLVRLHDKDVIRLGPEGKIRAAYPFSPVPTRHQVKLADGPRVDAMCVIDALGIPAMLDTDAVITTTALDGRQPIKVRVIDGRGSWEPATAVVFVGGRAEGRPSADTCCDYLNAFPDRAAGQAWVATHPEIPGDIITGAQAERLGRWIFGGLREW